MSLLLTIDPGIRGCGVAIFCRDTKHLYRAAYVKNADPTGQGLTEQHEMARCVLFWAEPFLVGEETALVAEWPQVYPGVGVNPNTALLPLCGVVAHVSALWKWKTRERYLPREWKGTLDGDVMVKRIEKRLSPDEIAAIESCPVSKRHNAVDAVGIGLHYFGRLIPQRVVHR